MATFPVWSELQASIGWHKTLDSVTDAGEMKTVISFLRLSSVRAKPCTSATADMNGVTTPQFRPRYWSASCSTISATPMTVTKVMARLSPPSSHFKDSVTSISLIQRISATSVMPTNACLPLSIAKPQRRSFSLPNWLPNNRTY